MAGIGLGEQHVGGGGVPSTEFHGDLVSFPEGGVSGDGLGNLRICPKTWSSCFHSR